MSKKLVSSLLVPSPLLDSSFIAEIVKAIPEDFSQNISTFSPVCLREEEALASANPGHNILMNNNKGKKRGNWRLGKGLPPLPLESELFTPPVDKGRRAERSISVLAETFLRMMPKQGKKVVMIKETAIMMNTSIKRVYTICNVLEGLRFVERKRQNVYEWKGQELLMPTLMLLMQMALKENMMGRIDKVNSPEDCLRMQHLREESERRGDPEQTPALNICMLTQKLMMVFLVLPQPKVISLPVANTVIHGTAVTAKQRNVCLQKLWDVSKILQEVGLIQKVTIKQGSEKPILAYQYVGEKVELVMKEKVVGEAPACTSHDENTSGLDKVLTDALNGESEKIEHVDKGHGDSSKVDSSNSVGIKVEVDDEVIESGDVSNVDSNYNRNGSRVLIDEERKVIKLGLVLEDEVCVMADME